MILTDFQMITIMGCVIVGVSFIAVPLLWEWTVKSKLWVGILIFGLIFLGWTSLHSHNCRNVSVQKCFDAHALNLTYNYCTEANYSLNATPKGLDTFCFYPLYINCNNIPNGCVKKEMRNIDGYCLSIIPICFLFNQP
jgi:hypothetical protein